MKHLMLAVILIPQLLHAQARRASRDAILAPVHQIFRAMAAGDSALLAESFHPNVRLATVPIDTTGMPGLQLESSIRPFQQAVAKAGAGVFYEPIRRIRIRRHGTYAEVWAKYDFYLRGRFHHCGIDSFQLIRMSDGWKIIHLTDTRETVGCRPGRRQKPRS